MRRVAAVLGVLSLALQGCSSVSVKHDYDREVDFQTYKNYAWSEAEMPDDELAKNPLVKKRVQIAVDKVLGSKGYSLAETERADFVVVVHAGIKERMRIQDYGRYGWYDPWWGPYGGRVDVSYFEEGTLVIDIVDAKKKELVWRGMATGIVRKYAKPEKMQEDINEDVRKILAGFPPGP
jgi:hypothetical protein